MFGLCPWYIFIADNVWESGHIAPHELRALALSHGGKPKLKSMAELSGILRIIPDCRCAIFRAPI